jgi:hypothetical protein
LALFPVNVEGRPRAEGRAEGRAKKANQRIHARMVRLASLGP